MLLKREEHISELENQIIQAQAEIDGMREDNQGSQSLITMELADYQRSTDALTAKLNTVSFRRDQTPIFWYIQKHDIPCFSDLDSLSGLIGTGCCTMHVCIIN